MLSFSSQQKQRCPAIEELLVDLIVLAMERSEENEAGMMETGCQLWHHLSSHLIFFVLFQFASFPHMVMSLYTKVQNNQSVDYRIGCLNLHILVTTVSNICSALCGLNRNVPSIRVLFWGTWVLNKVYKCRYVVIQFYPWFIFHFPLFQTHYRTSPYPKTKENKI